MGLEVRPDAMVVGVVSRLTEQKGLHLVEAVADELVSMGGQLAVLGAGDGPLEQAFVRAAERHPGQIAVIIGYDESLAHAIMAGADVILVPSRFEPCGLTQLYGLRYGALPVAHRVGGLADTVVDATAPNLEAGRATGFVFDEFTAQGLRGALRRAFELHAQPDAWARRSANGHAAAFRLARGGRPICGAVSFTQARRGLDAHGARVAFQITARP